METMELKLNSPITKEQWELITDTNLEHSDTMWFDTPNGNHFEYKKVRRGKWLKSNESRIRPYMCSMCGSLYDVDTVMGSIVWQYCPNCGARMDGE